MTSQELASLTVSDPAELIETVGYLLGFHPAESIVILGFDRAGPTTRRVEVALRVDLPGDSVRGGDFDELMQALARSQATALACIVVTERCHCDPRTDDLLNTVTRTLLGDADEMGFEVLDVLVATQHRWWSMLCEDEFCCPALGNERVQNTSVVAARATYAGLVALKDRAALLAQLEGKTLAEREHLRGLVCASFNDPQDREPAVAALLSAAAKPTSVGVLASAVTDADAARFGAALMSIAARDALWLRIDDGSIEATALLTQLHSRLPRPFDAPALFLFGWSRWRAGDGTLAAMAAERCLESDPTYSAANLLLAAVRRGVDPHRTPPLGHLPPLD